MSPLRINDMLKESEGKQHDILKRLKVLNKEAYKVMLIPQMSFKQKYSVLQKTDVWEEGRNLILEYELDGKKKLFCKSCGNEITRNFTLHHLEYSPYELFTPLLCSIVCKWCHGHIHDK